MNTLYLSSHFTLPLTPTPRIEGLAIKEVVGLLCNKTQKRKIYKDRKEDIENKYKGEKRAKFFPDEKFPWWRSFEVRKCTFFIFLSYSVSSTRSRSWQQGWIPSSWCSIPTSSLDLHVFATRRDACVVLFLVCSSSPHLLWRLWPPTWYYDNHTYIYIHLEVHVTIRFFFWKSDKYICKQTGVSISLSSISQTPWIFGVCHTECYMNLHGVTTLILWDFVYVIIIIISSSNHLYVNVTLEALRSTWHRTAKHVSKFTLHSFRFVR